MLEYYLEHWYLIPILIAAIIGVVILWSKALRKRSEANRVRNAEIARLEEQKTALDAYCAWLDNPAVTVTDKQLFIGFALDVQSRLQYESDQTAAFNALSEEACQIYALYFALEDVKYEKLSQFFREYGKPLTTEACGAVWRFADVITANVFAKMYKAYDPVDETSSLIPSQVTEWDAEFANALDMESVYARAAECVRGLSRMTRN